MCEWMLYVLMCSCVASWNRTCRGVLELYAIYIPCILYITYVKTMVRSIGCSLELYNIYNTIDESNPNLQY